MTADMTPSARMAKWHADVAAQRLTYENARRIHEGWSGPDDMPTSDSNDPWQTMPCCGHARGEIHPAECGDVA